MRIAAVAPVPESWQQAHRRLALALTLPVIAVAAAHPPGRELQLWFLVLGVGFLGLPHGAVDHLQGRAVFAPRFRAAWPVLFAASYLLGTGIVLFGWWLAPTLLLGLFLGAAIVHFGAEDQEQAAEGTSARFRFVAGVVRGALPVAGPTLWHPQETATLFAVLTPGTGSSRHAQVLEALAGPAALLHGAAAVLAVRCLLQKRLLAGAELAAIALLVGVAPPLLSFTIYFGLWHAPRHSLGVAVALAPEDPHRGLRHFLAHAGWLTVLTLCFAALAWWLATRSAPSREATLRVVFIGLAALTLPHVLLAIAFARSDGLIRSDREPPAARETGADQNTGRTRRT